MADIKLELFEVPVTFRDETTSTARAEGIDAAWLCPCGDKLPLVGRAYFQFGHQCHTICPSCNRAYRVLRDEAKRTSCVKEIKI